jgi:hypothetical protein
VAGPIFGALGAWPRPWRRGPTVRTALLAGGLLIAEPLVMLALGAARPHVLSAGTGLPLIARIIPGWGLTSASGGAAWAVYAAELMLGIAVVAVVLATRKRLRIPGGSPNATS